MKPEVILFDEPCSALDPISTAKIEELIDELKQDYTIVIVTHNMQQAARVSDFTAFMYLGELIEFGADRDHLHHAQGQPHPGLHHRPLRLITENKNMAEHTLKRFDEELERLSATISEMGGLAESQLAQSLVALRQRDSEVAEQVIVADARVDALDDAVQEQTVKLLALRQPMAVDLRVILSSIKIAAALERIADYAKNTAKRTIVLNNVTAPPSAVVGIDRLGRLVRTALKDVLDAFASGDVAKAHDVWQRDEEIDQVYTGLFRELLTYMMEDPRTITSCTHLLFMAKNIERAGDHVTNIAELVSFRTTGHGFDEARPKGSASLYAAGNAS